MLSVTQSSARGILYAALAYATVSLGDALIKVALGYHPILYIAFYTNITTFIILLTIAPFFGGYNRMVRTSNLKTHLARGLSLMSVTLLFLYAIYHMPIAQTYTFYLTQPFILAILAHIFLKEKIGLHRIISIVIGFSGVLIVLRPGALPIELYSLAALMCAFLFASSNLIVRFMDQGDSWMTYIFYAMAVQIPLLGLYLLSTQQLGAFPEIHALPYIAAGALCYTCALGLFPMAMQRIEAAVFGALEYSILFWGTLFGYILFAEIPDRWTITGAAVIVASGLYLVYRERKAHIERRIIISEAIVESKVNGTID
jgi:S-adenosylmethionine uptake transporter